MAYAKLHYGGQTYKLDDEQASFFLTQVNQALKSGDSVQLIHTTLAGGAGMYVAVSPSIPIAVEQGGSDSGPTATFV
ncbi:hypothetical protein [Nocardia wallacei]|uniref:hypothetical protein n=1 Tax=Nocardia wallacei TaxID=480035 RepID=UPI002455D11C|nr:hypothetical protein [Nocardia wallacei]